MKVEIEMYTWTCNYCGITSAMPKRVNENLRKCHNTFYCPSGHGNYYPQKSKEEVLQAELLAAQDKLFALRDKENIRLKKQRERNQRRKAKK